MGWIIWKSIRNHDFWLVDVLCQPISGLISNRLMLRIDMHMIQSYTYLTGNKFAHESSVFKDDLRQTSVSAKNELFTEL